MQKATEFENKISNATSVIFTPEYDRLAKLNFDARIKEVTKNIATNDYIMLILHYNDYIALNLEKE